MDDRSSNKKRDASAIITEGKISSAVWFLAWPTITNTLILTAYQFVNRIFLGHIPDSATAQAAIGIGDRALMVLFAIMVSLSVGTSALVARSLGAGNREDAEEATRQSLLMCVIGSAILTIPMVVWARPLVTMIGAKPGVVPVAAAYTAISALFTIPSFIWTIVTAALRSAGDVRSQLYVGGLMIALNILLDWVFIFGVGPVPALGVLGAAISTGISRVLASVLILWVLGRSVLKQSLTHLRISFSWLGRILNIGWPASIHNIIWTITGMAFLRILSVLPNATEAQAALTVGLTIESLAYMPGIAYGMAATPLVGQNLGAGNIERAERSAWIATWQAVIIMSFVALFFLAIPRLFAHAFTTNPAVAALIVLYLQVNAFAQPAQAIGFVLRGALQGAGDTRVPTWITLFSILVVRLVMAWVLVIWLQVGAIGAWISMAVSASLPGLLMSLWFKHGRWKTLNI
ncbi:MAG: MATE family efflux transporter [Armatimonadota bacterium]